LIAGAGDFRSGRAKLVVMRPVDRGQAITFLLSFGALPLGCPAQDDGESDTNATTPTTTAGSSASTTTGTEGTDSDASMSSTASSTSTTTTASSTDATTASTDATDVSVGTDPDTGYGTYGSSGGDPCLRLELPEVCAELSMHYAECYPKLRPYYAEGMGTYCACNLVYYAPMYGPSCASAWEELYACLNLLACGEMQNDSCPTELAAVDDACGFGEDTGGGE
jgi:hypothetical protein